MAADVPARDYVEDRGSRLDDWWASRSNRTWRLLRWAGPIVVVIIAALTRLWNLGYPHALVFDETFYVKDAWTLTNLGYESAWPQNADELFAGGNSNVYFHDPSFVVHPPLGKWLIGLGMTVLGPDNTFGWRIATALVGIVAVILIMVIARRLLNSTLLTTIAGFLMAIDGNAIVMSRVALLDNFVMFFALLGFGAVLLDRGWSEGRLERWVEARGRAGRGIHWGPALWWRPWLIAAGIAFGAASAVKWNGLYFLAGFAVYTLLVDALARRRAGVRFWASGTVFKQAPVTFLLTVPAAIATYMTTWTGWFLSDNGYDRHWAEQAGNAWTGALSWVPVSLQSFWHFEVAVYTYNIGESRPHAYQANPLTWLFMIRPTSMWYEGTGAGDLGCAANCGASITGIANPFIWWAATAAVFYLVYRLIRQREWRVGLILMGVAAGYLPWLLYLNRTVFQFYTIAFEPYLILALTLVIGLVLGSARDPRWRRERSIRLVGVYLAAVTLVSIFYWPLWTGMQIDYWYLAAHWWLPTWR
ncbi:MAG: phospholipid carrier-dependent glycosyltransferase [Salinibacterium sp.]|nr:MAG: phospholipid carrier-dependent glycosyltransferase [Salinibacterium sp.]